MIGTRLEGKVAQLLNARELVINIGSEDGVKEGVKFAVLAATPLDIRDPDTNEVLDQLDREKVRVEAKEVRDRVTVCATYEKRTVGSGWSAAESIAEALTGRREAPITLQAPDDSFPQPLPPSENYVKIGDRVRQISD